MNLCILALYFFSASSFSDILYVDPTDPNAHQTITNAVNAAQNGDTISISGGMYEEYVDLSGKEGITLQRKNVNTVTIQDPNSNDNRFTIKLGTGCHLSDLTIIHDANECNANEDSCSILAENISDIIINNCNILRGKLGNLSEQTGEGFGYAIRFIDTNNTTIDNCRIDGVEYGIIIKNTNLTYTKHNILNSDILTSEFDYRCNTAALTLEGLVDVSIENSSIYAKLGFYYGEPIANTAYAIDNSGGRLFICKSDITAEVPFTNVTSLYGLYQQYPGSETVLINSIITIVSTPRTSSFDDFSIFSEGGEVIISNVSWTPGTSTVGVTRVEAEKCVDCDREFFRDWQTWQEPVCWCYARNCRGDIDGLKNGPFWVSNYDFQIFLTAFNKTDAELAINPNGICADLNRRKEGPFRVSNIDLTEFLKYFNKTEQDVPVCD